MTIKLPEFYKHVEAKNEAALEIATKHDILLDQIAETTKELESEKDANKAKELKSDLDAFEAELTVLNERAENLVKYSAWKLKLHNHEKELKNVPIEEIISVDDKLILWGKEVTIHAVKTNFIFVKWIDNIVNGDRKGTQEVIRQLGKEEVRTVLTENLEALVPEVSADELKAELQGA